MKFSSSQVSPERKYITCAALPVSCIESSKVLKTALQGKPKLLEAHRNLALLCCRWVENRYGSCASQFLALQLIPHILASKALRSHKTNLAFIHSGLLKRHYFDEILNDALIVSKLCQVGQRALALLTSFKPVLPLMAIFYSNSKGPGQIL